MNGNPGDFPGNEVGKGSAIVIRPELPGDAGAIADVVTRAFAVARHASGTEAQIVDRLRSREKLTISLVAVIGERIVGYAAVSPVTVSDGSIGWYGLGPVAVSPERHRRGVGTRLIEETLAQLTEISASGCVVLGDPAFYGRFGFRANGQLVYPGVPGEYFQAIAWKGPLPRGTVSYDTAFDSAAGSA